MARQITGTIYKRGSTWWVEYKVSGQRVRKSLGTTVKSEARKRANTEVAALKLTGQAVKAEALATRASGARAQAEAALRAQAEREEAERPRLALKDAWTRFLDHPGRPQCGDSMLADYERRWRKFVEWSTATTPGITALESVNRDHAREFVKMLDEDSISANRRNKIVAGCRCIFKTLSEDCRGMENPFMGIRGRRLSTHGRRELSEGELRAVCGTAEGELRTLLAIGLYTALRLGDAALLRWESVWLDRNFISVTPRKTASRGKGKTLSIPIHPSLKTILEQTPPDARMGFVVPRLAEKYSREPASLCKVIRQHFEDCGIQTQERHADQKQASSIVGYHSLRHSFASMCAAKGVPLAVVQHLCGHSSPAITERYLHINGATAQEAMAALPSITGPAAEPSSRDQLLDKVKGMNEAQAEAALRALGGAL